MIPTQNGVVMEDDPAEPGTRPIYRILASGVPEFMEKFNQGGVEFVPLYSDVIALDR